MKVVVIRTTGETEAHTVVSDYIGKVAELIGAATIDTVNIFKAPQNRGMYGMRMPVMVIDDHGYDVEVISHGPGKMEIGGVEIDAAFREERRPTRALKPENARATELYHSICKPGTDHKIVGDVAIIDDEEV